MAVDTAQAPGASFDSAPEAWSMYVLTGRLPHLLWPCHHLMALDSLLPPVPSL